MKALRCLLVFLFTLACISTFAQNSNQPAPKLTYIRAGQLFDATSDAAKSNMVIVIAGDRIQKIGTAAEISIPANSDVIDLSNATVLPGLIDCHTHLQSRGDRYNPIYEFRDTPFSHAFAGVVNARKTLDAGFTSVRDVGSDPFLAVDLRN